MKLTCIRCRGVIEPDDRMVVVTTGMPCKWKSSIDDRLLIASRWHWQCAPRPIRQYAPAVTVEDPTVQMIVLAVAASILAWVIAPSAYNAIDDLLELVFTAVLRGTS